MKKVARRPNIAKTAEVKARNKSGTWAMMALTESTAKRRSVTSRQQTTRKSMVALHWYACSGSRSSSWCEAKSTVPYLTSRR